MAQTTISIRVDEEIKREAEILCSQIGLTLSAVTNVFFRQMVRTQGIPFPITAARTKEQSAGELLREALREAQEQASVNGTSEMTMTDIDAVIAEVRRESRGKQ
jgi:DNA-damage-inducible protein J